jgi:hypothetical protein
MLDWILDLECTHANLELDVGVDCTVGRLDCQLTRLIAPPAGERRRATVSRLLASRPGSRRSAADMYGASRP